MYAGEQTVTLVVDGLTLRMVFALRSMIRSIYAAQLDDVIALRGMSEPTGEYDNGARVELRVDLVMLVSSYLAQFNTLQQMCSSDLQLVRDYYRGGAPMWILELEQPQKVSAA